MSRGKKYSWAQVRLEHLTELLRQGWQWWEDPHRHRLCLKAPRGKVFDFRARPQIEIREHPVVNEQLL
jgi:hypothetical protein